MITINNVYFDSEAMVLLLVFMYRSNKRKCTRLCLRQQTYNIRIQYAITSIYESFKYFIINLLFYFYFNRKNNNSTMTRAFFSHYNIINACTIGATQ